MSVIRLDSGREADIGMDAPGPASLHLMLPGITPLQSCLIAFLSYKIFIPGWRAAALSQVVEKVVFPQTD
jgi:hypothetical protein